MKKTDVVMGNFFVAPGMRARVSINDVPLFPSPMVGQWSKQLPINHRLVEGENHVSVSLEETASPLIRASVDEREVERFSFVIFKARSEAEGDFEFLAQCRLDRHWQGVPESRRRYPFYTSRTFDPGVPTSPPAWVSSEVVTAPCEGTPEQRDLVREYFDITVAADRDRLIAISEPFFSDYEKSFPGETYYARGTLLAELDEMIAEAPVYEPLEPHELHYEARAGGRVVYVSRLDGRSVLRAKGSDGGAFNTDLLLTKTVGGWRVM